jgi:hypothetical protein
MSETVSGQGKHTTMSLNEGLGLGFSVALISIRPAAMTDGGIPE